MSKKSHSSPPLINVDQISHEEVRQATHKLELGKAITDAAANHLKSVTNTPDLQSIVDFMSTCREATLIPST